MSFPPWSGEIETPDRIDPRGCGCTDCLTGDSIPLEQATPEQAWALMTGSGSIQDATSVDWSEAKDAVRDAFVDWLRSA